MKLRTPGTLSAAINKIKAQLSEQLCAKIVERSESLIRKWADPDDPALPNLRQSLLLDAAFVKQGFGEPPIQSWYLDRLNGIIYDEPKQAVDLVLSTLKAQSAIGQISSMVAQFTVDGSRRQETLSANERAVLLGMIEDLSDELDELEASLEEHVDVPELISLKQFLAK